jgi:two-component system phosphate regulon response regulator PhoB
MSTDSAYLIRPSVLLVEDDPAIRTLIVYHLERHHFRIRTTDNAEEALLLIEEALPDIVLLDWMLRGRVSGVALCSTLRQRAATKQLPILLLTARGEETDRVQGLDAGADDYIVKPFSLNELVARITAVLRRTRPTLTSAVIAVGSLTLNKETHQVTYEGRPCALGPTEFRLLQAFLEHPARVFSRDILIQRGWDAHADVEPRTIDVHINRLRKAIGNPDIIRTVRGGGYALADLDKHTPPSVPSTAGSA